MAKFGVRDARNKRVTAGKKQTDLVAESGIGVATIRKIESGIPVSEASCWAVFNVLDRWQNSSLNRADVYEIKNDD